MSESKISEQALRRELEWRACFSEEAHDTLVSHGYCDEDHHPFVHFLESFWMITPLRAAPKIIKLWSAQREIIDMYLNDDADHVISLKARQIGWTTITTAYAFWTAYFFDYTPWLFVSQNEDYAVKNLNMVRFGYNRLPKWFRDRGPEVTKSTTEVFTLSNGSKIESIPATSGAGRGDAVWGVMWDEVAQAPDPEDMYAALDPLCYGKMLLLSTASGQGNFFHSTWLDSQEKYTAWDNMFQPWHARPGRDDEWYEQQKIKFRGQNWILHQEYPRNPEEAFAKSGRTAIDYDLLQEQEWIDPIAHYKWDGKGFDYDNPLDEYEAIQEPLILDVWEEPTVHRDEHERPKYDPNYVIFCDPAEGLEHGDATAIVVYDANTRACVARIRTHYPAEEIPEVLAHLGYHYMTALVMVERNSLGWGILHALHRFLMYPRIYRMEQIAKIVKGDRTLQLGWHTNNATKPKMVGDYLRAMRAGEVETRDPRFRMEAMTFVIDERGRMNASPGNHDDVIIAHFGALQGVDDVGRFPILWEDDRPVRPPTFDELYDIAFGKERVDSLHSPIGRKPTKGATKRSFWITPT